MMSELVSLTGTWCALLMACADSRAGLFGFECEIFHLPAVLGCVP